MSSNLLLCLLTFVSCVNLYVSSRALSAAAKPQAITHVFLISIDGLRPDALKQAKSPNIASLWKNGTYTWKAQTVLPSVTLVAHASMLSGVRPEKHGINWNKEEESKGSIKVPTLFDYAHKSHLSTAMIVGKKKFTHLRRPGMVDYYSFAGFADERVGSAAAEYIVSHKPNVCFIHFPGPDTAGHAFGWMSEQQIKAVEDCDREIGKILKAIRSAGIASQTILVLTADHGGHERTHGTNMPVDMTIPWICWGANVKKNHPLTARVNTCDSAATVLYALGIAVPTNWDGRPVKEAFVRNIPGKVRL